MPVAPRHARTRLIGEPTHAELARSQCLPREPPLHVNVPRADIAKLVEVLPRPVGHLETVAPTKTGEPLPRLGEGESLSPRMNRERELRRACAHCRDARQGALSRRESGLSHMPRCDSERHACPDARRFVRSGCPFRTSRDTKRGEPRRSWRDESANLVSPPWAAASPHETRNPVPLTLR